MVKENIKILIIDHIHRCMQEMFAKQGYSCDFMIDSGREKILKVVGNYIGIIVRSRIKIDKEIIDRATKLKFIGRVGAGMESIDREYAETKGIHCFNSPEGNRDAVGEHTLGMLIALMNNFILADRQVRNGEWKREENRGEEIKGKTIGLIGYGNMGSAFARRLRGFDARVIAYDKYKFNYSDEYVKETSEEEIFESADILSLHVPLTEETNYLVNKDYINKFKKNFWLINTSRGFVVKTNDLADAIESGKIKGAALDVIEYEDSSFKNLQLKALPEAWNYLINSDKVILSPHIAGWTSESEVKLAEVLANKVIAFLKSL